MFITPLIINKFMTKEDFHIDMSNKIYKMKTIGIACIGAVSKKHNGCALKGNLIKFIQKNLCVGDIKEEYAKVYAICIYHLIKDKIGDIDALIVCNDEEFTYVKEYLLILLGIDSSRFKIISITDFRKALGRKISSPADNFAKSYRKRALKPTKWKNGKQLDVVEITYDMIKKQWEKLKIV